MGRQFEHITLAEGQGQGNDGFLYCAMYCTLHRDRYREPWVSVVSLPVPVPVLVLCSVYKL